MKLIKYGLFVFFAAFLWGKTDKAMASSCSLISAVSNVTINHPFNFKANSNGANVTNEDAPVTFWSGSSDETYVCPAASQSMYICGTDDQYNIGGHSTFISPGITAGAAVTNGSPSVNTLTYGGCWGVSISGGPYPASGQMKDSLTTLNGWNKALAFFFISDSTQARNITITNKLVGRIFLTTDWAADGSPLTTVYVSGTITVPASCKLASNSVVILPDTYSGDYGKAGTGAKVGTGTTQPMSIQCLGGSESATIDLHVTTSKVSGDDIVTSNPDVGVRVLDGSGNTVSANNGDVSATLSDGAVDVPFTYVPVAITGKNPTPGDYSAIETITVTIP